MVKRTNDAAQEESKERDYIPPRVFKEMTRLNKQREKLEGLLSEVNAFNAKAKAAEIGKVLDKYIPSVEKMSTQVRKYIKVFGSMKAENAALELANFLHLSHKLKAYYEIFTLSNDKVDFILCKFTQYFQVFAFSPTTSRHLFRTYFPTSSRI